MCVRPHVHRVCSGISSRHIPLLCLVVHLALVEARIVSRQSTANVRGCGKGPHHWPAYRGPRASLRQPPMIKGETLHVVLPRDRPATCLIECCSDARILEARPARSELRRPDFLSRPSPDAPSTLCGTLKLTRGSAWTSERGPRQWWRWRARVGPACDRDKNALTLHLVSLSPPGSGSAFDRSQRPSLCFPRIVGHFKLHGIARSCSNTAASLPR